MPDRPAAAEGRSERAVEWAEERADERRTNRKNWRLASSDYLCEGRKRRIDGAGLMVVRVSLMSRTGALFCKPNNFIAFIEDDGNNS